VSKRILVVCVVVAETMTVWAAQASNDALVANARAIHERVMTIDTHIDFDPAHFTAACNYTRRLVTQVYLP
jgi:hypothetical protein